MTSLTFYGGAGEIGGNKILLEDKGVKVYLDFGESFDFGEDFFYEYLAPRTVNGLEVYFEFDLIPKIRKLYSEKNLRSTELKYEKSDVDAIVISHPHSDHIGHLKFLDENIPIYIGHGTYELTKIYHNLYPQFCNLGEHNSINLFKSGDAIKIKHITIEPIHVEHSTPGAYGFIIHTSKGQLVYTGDFRLHGPKKEFSEEFIGRAASVKPLAMLCEGTRMSSEVEHNYTESEVETKVSDIIKQSKGTIFAFFSMMNIDRFMSFYLAARKNNRILVIDTKLAYIINNMRADISRLPDVVNDENIRVYYRIAKSCTFSEKDYYPWEREFMLNMINYEEIKENPPKYVMHLNFYRLMELVYLQPNNADFIYSSSEHFLEGEDNKEQRKIWENWMDHFKIRFHKVHCSGHASKKDIIDTVKKINPNILIPVHTLSPEEFEKIHENVILPRKNNTIELK